MSPRTLALSLSASLLLTACDNPTGLTSNKLPVTVSGQIQNRSGATIPANARVVVLWAVSAASQDYAYIFGEGSVTPATGQFTITFAAEPPTAALNGGELGVGLVLLTTDANLAQGQVPDTYDYAGFLGASEDHAIIFVKESVTASEMSWGPRFPQGYSVGEVERNPAGFDAFKRVALTVLGLVVDAMDNITVPNWT